MKLDIVNMFIAFNKQLSSAKFIRVNNLQLRQLHVGLIGSKQKTNVLKGLNGSVPEQLRVLIPSDKLPVSVALRK